MWSNLRLDLHHAFRSIARQPVFTLVVLATLAIGIGANTAMFALIHAALIKPLPYADPDRLLLARRTLDTAPGRALMWNSGPDYYDYRDQTTGFESLAASSPEAGSITITGQGRPERVKAMQVSYDLVSTLGVAPVAGRTFRAEEGVSGGAPVAMLGARLATRRFGSPEAAIGKAIEIPALRSKLSATIVGVLPASFRFLDTVDLYIPMHQDQESRPETRMFHNWVLVGRLKPGVSMATVQSQINVVARRLQQLYPASNKVKGLRVDPLQSALLQSQTPRLMVLMGAVGVLLLIACANVAGMLLARGVARRPEIAVRAALGASRARIAGQLVTESLALSGLAGIAGILLALWLRQLLPIATGLADAGVVASGLETQVLVFAVAAAILTGVLCGVAPALRASALRLVEHLAPGVRATDSRGGARLRSVLVALQVALSLVLLIGAGLLIRSLAGLMSTELGFQPEHLVTTSVEVPYPDDARRVRFQTDLYDALSAVPRVTALAFTSHTPFLEPWGDPPMYAATRPPTDSSQERTAFRRCVLPGFFRTMGIPLLAGRDLSPADRAGTPRVMVINEPMAREFFPGEDPIGQRVVLPGGGAPRDYEVVGVVKGARTEMVGEEPYPSVYVAANQEPQRSIKILARTTLAPEQLASALRRIVTARDPDIPVEAFVPMEEIVGESLASQRVTTLTLTTFSIIALLLAAMGLYGVLAHYVTQRTHEIGVRVALGAGTRLVVAHVLWRSATMVGPGIALGLLASLAGTRLIARFLYGVPPTDPLTFAGVSAGLALVAGAASAWPAWRAARVDPVRALRGQ